MTSTAITRPTDEDLHIWNQGHDHRAHEMLGARLHETDPDTPGVPRHGRAHSVKVILPPVVPFLRFR